MFGCSFESFAVAEERQLTSGNEHIVVLSNKNVFASCTTAHWQKDMFSMYGVHCSVFILSSYICQAHGCTENTHLLKFPLPYGKHQTHGQRAMIMFYEFSSADCRAFVHLCHIHIHKYFDCIETHEMLRKK